MAQVSSPPRPLRFERRMSEAEALMWNLEKDPSLRSAFLQVTFLDRPPSFDGFRRRIERAVAELPRLRQRVVPSPARMAPPEWADDPSFDLDFHVRRFALPAPGTDRQLLDLAALHLQDPFDRARPLWQYSIVEGLSGGRAALLAKMHHTITDGVGGVRLSAMFLDLERNPPEPDPDETAAAVAVESPLVDRGFLEEVADAIGHGLRRQLGITQRAAATVGRSILDPMAVPRAAATGIDLLRSALRQVVVTDPARSPLWTGKRSLGRHFEVATFDLDRLKVVANGLGGTVNDAFVTAMAGAAGAYHRQLGAEVDELRVSIIISTRGDKSAGGNAFAPSRLLVPVAGKDPVERFGQIRERLTASKSDKGVQATAAIAGVLNALPTSLIVGLTRNQVQTVDFATSNLRAAPFDLYTAGAEIMANHPMGPTGGTAFNATVMSYRGQLDLGLNIDTAAVEDPGLLKECTEDAFAELLSVEP